MPSNKEVWTLPLPPNLAPLQCARALPAASAVARAARPAWPPLPFASRAAELLLARSEAGMAGGRAGEPASRQAGKQASGRGAPAGEGRAGTRAAAPFPAQTPLPSDGVAPAHTGSACCSFRGLRHSRAARSLLSPGSGTSEPQPAALPLEGTSIGVGGGGGGEHSCLQGFNCAPTPTSPGGQRG